MPRRYTVPGPCTVSWGGVSLGYTKAGVTILPQTQLIPIIDDEHGTEPADWIRAGKSAVVTAVFNDPAAIKAAQPFIGALLSNLDSGGDTQLGKLANDGDTANLNQLGKELIITERDNTNLWKAKYTLPTDPETLALASTVEFLAPISFVVALDDDDTLFYLVPDYMR